MSGSHSHSSARQRHVAETRYSAFDRELLAVYATIRHFRHSLLNTDHKPLTYVMTSVTEHPSLRQTGHSAFIAEGKDQALDTEFTRLRHSTSSTLNFQ